MPRWLPPSPSRRAYATRPGAKAWCCATKATPSSCCSTMWATRRCPSTWSESADSYRKLDSGEGTRNPLQMNALRIRNGAIAGIVGAIVTVVAGLITGAPPSPDDPAGKFRNFMVDHRNAIRWQMVLFALGIVLLVWFFAAFSSLMSRGDTPTPFALLPVLGTMGILGIG